MRTLPLNDGGTIPTVGLGTSPLDDDESERVVAMALEVGYRLVDTAYNYRNETGVGRGIAASGVPRDELFITSKLNREFHSVQGVTDAFEGSARRLGTDYLDLFLIHWPNPDQNTYVEAWEGLIALRDQGKVRHIGTSNFLPEHLESIIAATGVAPAVDQLQMNPRWTQPQARAYNAAHSIVTQAWSPMGDGNGLLAQPVVIEVADRNGITPGEAVIAWTTALGMSTVPRSTNPERLARNLAAADITLSRDDVEQLMTLDGTEPDVLDPSIFGH